jgi:hypothetical protein
MVAAETPPATPSTKAINNKNTMLFLFTVTSQLAGDNTYDKWTKAII